MGGRPNTKLAHLAPSPLASPLQLLLELDRWDGDSDPVDDIEDEEDERKCFTGELVDVARALLARLYVDGACEVTTRVGAIL